MKLSAQQVAGIGAVVLHFLAVAAVLNFLAVQLLQGNGGNNSQRNALVCGTEYRIEIQAKVVMNGASVVLTQALQLTTRNIGASIHEKGGFAPALKREFAELEHMAFHHELDEFFLICLHERTPSLVKLLFSFYKSLGQSPCGYSR